MANINPHCGLWKRLLSVGEQLPTSIAGIILNNQLVQNDIKLVSVQYVQKIPWIGWTQVVKLIDFFVKGSNLSLVS